MDIPGVTAESCVHQATAQQSVGTTVSERQAWAADEPAGILHHAHEILSAIINHHSVPSTLQMVADALVTLCPSKGVAIFLRSGPQLHIEVEAGLPNRPPGAVLPQPAARSTPVLVAAGAREDPVGTLPRWDKYWLPGSSSAWRRP
jgi:hypothetical protein